MCESISLQWADSLTQSSDFFVFVFVFAENKRGKSFVCHPSFYCMNKQELFIYLISPQTLSVHKCKQHTQCCCRLFTAPTHPSKTTTWFSGSHNKYKRYRESTTGNNTHLIQSFTLMQRVLKSKFILFAGDVILFLFFKMISSLDS